MQPKIVFLDRYCIGQTDTTPLKVLGHYTEYDHLMSSEQVLAHSQGADVLITNKARITGEMMLQLPSLKLISVASTGVNHVDIEAAAQLGIEVRNAAGYSTHAVCETTIGAAIALRRQIIYYDRYTKSQYEGAERQFHFGPPMHQLHGSAWGVIGMGAIGREVAKVASALGCEVRYCSTSGIERDEQYPRIDLSQMLSWADVISIHAPLTSATKGLIGSAELALIKPTAILINVARGGIVDESALASALNAGQLAGAALDVFAHEPMEQGNPLMCVNDLDRLLLSPHNAWQPIESTEALVECMVQNIKKFYKLS